MFACNQINCFEYNIFSVAFVLEKDNNNELIISTQTNINYNTTNAIKNNLSRKRIKRNQLQDTTSSHLNTTSSFSAFQAANKLYTDIDFDLNPSIFFVLNQQQQVEERYAEEESISMEILLACISFAFAFIITVSTCLCLLKTFQKTYLNKKKTIFRNKSLLLL